MRRPRIALLAFAIIACTPMLAAADVVISFASTTPSTTNLATISYFGSYATPLPSPTAAPFAAVPFSFTATLPSQFYVPAGIGVGLYLPNVTGTYSNAGTTTPYENGVLELLGQVVESYGSNGIFSVTHQTYFNLIIPSLLATNDQYDLTMVANNFLYTEQDPLVSQPLPAPPLACPYCTPVIATILPGAFNVLSGGFADYTPPLQSDPRVSINSGGTGIVTTQGTAGSVPEPGTLPLLTVGLLLVALGQRRTRRRSAEDSARSAR
ncbi:MAG: PEP-CTERM sorting domain-containing protein [Steroidobacteraceae bacterium]